MSKTISCDLKTKSDAQLNWHGQFASKDWEMRFRDSRWKRDSQRMRLIGLITGVAYLAGFFGDYVHPGLESDQLSVMASLRILVFLAGIGCALLAVNRKCYQALVFYMAGYMLLVMFAESVELVFKFVPGEEQQVPFTLVILLMFYVFLPLQLLPTVLVGVLAGILFVSALALFTPAPAAHLVCLLLFFSLTNAFGVYFLLSFSKSQRGEFQALAGQQETNQRLEQEIFERKEAEREQKRLVEELRGALAEVKTLQGLIPICANCKKIRDDKGYWQQLEKYIQDRSDAVFSHGICPDCARKYYPEVADELGADA